MRVHTRAPGFTLIELLVVMAIVALLLSLAVPRYFGNLGRAKETALLQTLALTRDSIDKYYSDNGKYPADLQTLVSKRYLRGLPVDPITESNATWTLVAPEDPEQGGLYNIYSGAQGTGRDGTPFKQW